MMVLRTPEMGTTLALLLVRGKYFLCRCTANRVAMSCV